MERVGYLRDELMIGVSFVRKDPKNLEKIHVKEGSGTGSYTSWVVLLRTFEKRNVDRGKIIGLVGEVGLQDQTRAGIVTQTVCDEPEVEGRDKDLSRVFGLHLYLE